MFRRVLLVLSLVLLCAAGCTGGGASSGTSSTVPKPAGATPSLISLMVCSPKAVAEIDGSVGEKAVVTGRTWIDHRYSCRFEYPTGSMVLSVKELSSWPQTTAYFASLASGTGSSSNIPGLGQGAVQTENGSMVVRKDWKVLWVDTRGLPARFGVPATSSANVALRVSYLILGCWAGD